MSEQALKPPLHDRPHTVLEFVRRHVRMHRVAPSIREIMEGCGLTTTSVVEYYLRRLEREGYIRRAATSGNYHASRGIVLVAAQSAPRARMARGRTRVTRIVTLLEQLFPMSRDPECDICGQASRADGDRFCAGCRCWLERFALTTSPARAAADLARALAAMLRSGERPAEWSAPEGQVR